LLYYWWFFNLITKNFNLKVVFMWNFFFPVDFNWLVLVGGDKKGYMGFSNFC
jgi:hypothetical protein